MVDVDDEKEGSSGCNHVAMVVFDGGPKVQFATLAGMKMGAGDIRGVE